VVWGIGIGVLEEPAASIFRVFFFEDGGSVFCSENGGSMFFGNIGACLLNLISSCPRRDVKRRKEVQHCLLMD
jgi:hypothetical protein